MGLGPELPTSSQSNRTARRSFASCFFFLAKWIVLGSIGYGQTVEVNLLDGQIQSGILTELDSTELTIVTKSGPTKVSLSSVATLKSKEGRDEEPGPFQLQLIDGSQFFLKKFIGKGNLWTASSSVVGEVGFTSKSLQWLRFRPLIDEAQQASWTELISDPTQSDALIVARPSGDLARVGGTIMEAKEGHIGFDFDDQKLEMPIEKLLALVWFQSESSRLRPSIEVVFRDRSRWKVDSVRLTSDGLSLSSTNGPITSGKPIVVPISKVSTIQFGTTNTRWVSELEKLESWVQYPRTWKYSLEISKSASLPRFVMRTKGGGTAEQDLLFIVPGTYVFRMPENFTKFESKVERPPLIPYRPELTIEVWQEESRVFHFVLTKDMDSVEVRATLAPEKKVKLVVASSSQSILGTEVQWKQPRVLR